MTGISRLQARPFTVGGSSTKSDTSRPGCIDHDGRCRLVDSDLSGCLRLAPPGFGKITVERGRRMSLPTPLNERLSMTEPSGALASCA
jgi:hypothetical protein